MECISEEEKRKRSTPCALWHHGDVGRRSDASLCQQNVNTHARMHAEYELLCF
jgi:hypothetical protein